MGSHEYCEPIEASKSRPTMTTASIEALQGSEQRELMDLVDRLRRAGLSTILQLPQIVVCGDQSSGKSSVLEAVTEIPLPRKENLCTRFATEISLRRGSVDSITCRINPGEDRSDDESERLRGFSRTITEFHELPSLMEEATEIMGLGPSKAFSRDVLSIEICGPNRPQLTLIDLPGLIHSSNKSQSEEDIELIKSLVRDYISKQRTIMLAVISAKNDYANQIILKMCREFDTNGSRTLGIITKPDFLRPGSENEGAWLDLARNKDVFFELGWHLLKNRSDDQHSLSFDQRNLDEQLFFQKGSYNSLPRSMTGVNSLRDRLSQLLFDHLRRGLPDLKEELENVLLRTTEELELLGQSRETVAEQRVYLADLATSASNLIRMACDGSYDAPFFGNIDVDAEIEAEQNFSRLRAVVQHLNIQFGKRIRTHGHTFQICKTMNSEQGVDEGAGVEPWIAAKKKARNPMKKPTSMTRHQAIKWASHIQERIRGRELPGVFNPMIIGHIFQEQSIRWEEIARKHIDAVANTCKRFVLRILSSLGTSEVREKLTTLKILPFLKQAHEAALLELKHILKDKGYHPITYNHYFTDNIQKIQQDRYVSHFMSKAQESTIHVMAKTHTPGAGYEAKDYIEPAVLERGFRQTVQHDMEKFAAEQALDAHDAFYKDELKYFVDVVTKQGIERHLLAPLVDVLSPRSVARYTEEQLRHIAAEPAQTKQFRVYLETKRKMLEDGREAFQEVNGHMESVL